VQEWIGRIRQQAPARQHEEEVMFGRKARAERRAQAEADRLFALADELEKHTTPRPNYAREISAERAARIRERLGDDLARDARAQDPAKARSHEPELQGPERDAEIDRLADRFGEPVPVFGPRPDGTYASAIDSDIVAEVEASGERASAAGRDAADHLYGSPESAEADPETAHFGTGPGEPQDAGRPLVQPSASTFSGYRHEMYPEKLQGLRQAGAEDAQRIGAAAVPGIYPYGQPQAQLEAG
jgi:hypothetical protein